MVSVKRINKIIKATSANEFQIDSYRAGNIILIGSFDWYYHDIAVEFVDSYISLPTEFSYPRFRIANKIEIQQIRQLVLLEPEVVYCIEAETSCSIEKIPFYLVAESTNIQEGRVYHYWKKDLKPGERIADWVKKPN